MHISRLTNAISELFNGRDMYKECYNNEQEYKIEISKEKTGNIKKYLLSSTHPTDVIRVEILSSGTRDKPLTPPISSVIKTTNTCSICKHIDHSQK